MFIEQEMLTGVSVSILMDDDVDSSKVIRKAHKEAVAKITAIEQKMYCDAEPVKDDVELKELKQRKDDIKSSKHPEQWTMDDEAKLKRALFCKLFNIPYDFDLMGHDFETYDNQKIRRLYVNWRQLYAHNTNEEAMIALKESCVDDINNHTLDASGLSKQEQAISVMADYKKHQRYDQNRIAITVLKELGFDGALCGDDDGNVVNTNIKISRDELNENIKMRVIPYLRGEDISYMNGIFGRCGKTKFDPDKLTDKNRLKRTLAYVRQIIDYTYGVSVKAEGKGKYTRNVFIIDTKINELFRDVKECERFDRGGALGLRPYLV